MDSVRGGLKWVAGGEEGAQAIAQGWLYEAPAHRSKSAWPHQNEQWQSKVHKICTVVEDFFAEAPHDLVLRKIDDAVEKQLPNTQCLPSTGLGEWAFVKSIKGWVSTQYAKLPSVATLSWSPPAGMAQKIAGAWDGLATMAPKSSWRWLRATETTFASPRMGFALERYAFCSDTSREILAPYHRTAWRFHLVRGLRRTLNHAADHCFHAVFWYYFFNAIGHLQPDVVVLATATSLMLSLLPSLSYWGFLLPVAMTQEVSFDRTGMNTIFESYQRTGLTLTVKTKKSIKGKVRAVQQGMLSVRKTMNASWLIPLAGCWLSAYWIPWMNKEKIASWPIAVPLAIAAGVSLGDYLGRELKVTQGNDKKWIYS